MVQINKKQIAYNHTARTQKPIYIVIHDTGNPGKGANANAHFNYFNGGNRNSSADFFVDDTQVLQVNDYTKYYTWHCGDGKGKYGITNSNSIGIEICINGDGNYDVAFSKAVELTKHLMKELNIPLERVVRHYDASRKNCPASMNSWALWNTFKKRLTKNEEDLTMAQYDELKKEIGSIRTLTIICSVFSLSMTVPEFTANNDIYYGLWGFFLAGFFCFLLRIFQNSFAYRYG